MYNLIQAIPTLLPSIVHQVMAHSPNSSKPQSSTVSPQSHGLSRVEYRHALGCLSELLTGLQGQLWLHCSLPAHQLSQTLMSACWQMLDDVASLKVGGVVSDYEHDACEHLVELGWSLECYYAALHDLPLLL